MPELEIFSDFSCVWCYFNKPQIKKLEKEYDIQIHWRAFPLNPDIPDEGMPVEELFGHNIALMNDKMNQLEKTASSFGLPLINRKTISNSRRAQELAKWADTKGKIAEFQDAIYIAYFSNGLNITDKSVLLDIVDACGLAKNDAQKVIETGVFSNAVDMDWQKSEELVIQVAPTYILNNSRLMGFQTYERLEGLMIANNIPKK